MQVGNHPGRMLKLARHGPHAIGAGVHQCFTGGHHIASLVGLVADLPALLAQLGDAVLDFFHGCGHGAGGVALGLGALFHVARGAGQRLGAVIQLHRQRLDVLGDMTQLAAHVAERTQQTVGRIVGFDLATQIALGNALGQAHGAGRLATQHAEHLAVQPDAAQQQGQGQKHAQANDGGAQTPVASVAASDSATRTSTCRAMASNWW